MSHDNPVLQALAQAVEADPSNLNLRVHFAELLLQHELPNEALGQCAAVLAIQPDFTNALRVAIEAADKSGQSILASSYRRIYESLEIGRAHV